MRGPLDAMAAHRLDLLVVGGGIAGAAAAREAALRGLRVGLVEAHDFGAGTTAATTRLAHGGLRYLERLDVGQVREGLRERQWLLRAAPHLVEPLPFLFPLPTGRRGFAARLRMGLALYDLLTPRGFPRRRWLSGEAAHRDEPRLRPAAVHVAAAFHDGQILFPERLVLEFALGAAAAGAAVANHAAVVALARDAEGWRATVEDRRVDRRVEVRARAVLNCAGPWVERLAGLAGLTRGLTRRTRGTHVALPNVLRRALILRASDGRTFFATPWNEVTLVGTTDLDDAGDPSDVVATAQEVQYLLREAGAFADLDDVTPCYTTAGVRALLRVEGVRPGDVPRGHVTLDHARDGAPGFFSVVGGKLTTGRAVGRDAVAMVAAWLGNGTAPAPDAPLPGNPGATAPRAPPGTLPHSLGLLGARASLAASGRSFCGHLTEGLVQLAAAQEGCAGLGDLLFRRALCAHAPDLGAHALDAAAASLGKVLGWDAAEREAQREAFLREAARRRAGLPG